MVIRAEILEVSEQAECDLVTFQFVVDDGSTIGPRIERRPKGENHQGFVDTQMAEMNSEI